VDVSEAIQERRSIRKFKEDPVPKEKLIDILEAATLAPSGKNKQTWKFISSWVKNDLK
jgi:nitroreductase